MKTESIQYLHKKYVKCQHHLTPSVHETLSKHIKTHLHIRTLSKQTSKNIKLKPLQFLVLNTYRKSLTSEHQWIKHTQAPVCFRHYIISDARAAYETENWRHFADNARALKELYLKCHIKKFVLRWVNVGLLHFYVADKWFLWCIFS